MGNSGVKLIKNMEKIKENRNNEKQRKALELTKPKKRQEVYWKHHKETVRQ